MQSPVVELTYNLAVLVAMTAMSGFIRHRWPDRRWGTLLQGVLFGVAALIGMMRPLTLGPGLIFDGRSVVISLCGLFFGPLAVAVSGGMALVYRVILGGPGLYMGTFVIIASALLGFLFHCRWQRLGVPLTAERLFGLGCVVHGAMLLLMFTLPDGIGLAIITQLGLPIMLTYPLATLIIGMLISSQEIGFRSLTALKKNQRLLTEIEKLGKVGGWEIKIDTGKLSWTDEVYAIHEVERSFTPAVESALNFYTPESRTKIEQAVQKAIDHGEPFDLDLEMTTAKGNQRIVHSIGNAELDTRIIYGFFQDITDQQQAITALCEQQLQYRHLADSGLALIWTANTDKLCHYFNVPWLRFTGRSLADQLGNGWAEGLHPDDYDTCLQTYVAAFDKREAFNMECRLRHHSGEYRWLQNIGTPNYNSKGEFIGYIGHCFDITERKIAEQEREKMQAHLNQAQKMEAIGVLAGGIAHDFNNILSAILGFTELAREDVPHGSHLAHDLDRVLTSAHRATELVKQILAFSRQSNADRVPLKIQPLIKESLKMLRASLPTTIDIKEDISPECGTILADPTQIHQIIMNLCTNAFHAMETTGGTLQVSALSATITEEQSLTESQSLPPGEYVELVVKDSGTGIGPEIIKRIFDPYFTTKDIGKGTGMGLSITHGIIRSYGGTITVESTLGHGATFNLYFPVSQEKEQKTVEAQETPRGSGRILFVDDEEMLMEMGRDMLQRLGYTVTAHSRSMEALTTFTNAPDAFDAVITDQTMPAMTGTELAKRMLEIRPDLPIILCTGYSNLISEDMAKAIGIREFAFKPLSRAAIGQLLKKVLSPVSLRR